MSLLRFVPAVALAGLVGCGLERPIEPQPMESVIQQWRQEVLAETSTRLVGTTLEVPSAQIAGDFGRLTWTESQAAEATATQGEGMVAIELLAGGGDSRWGMAILGIFLPAFDDLRPGEKTLVPASEASLIGCSGMRLLDWDIDEAAEATTIEMELDVADPTLAHLTFVGEFANGSTLSGRFTIERSTGWATTP